MKKVMFVGSIALFLFSALANAHGPVRQKTEEQITINAPADKVWDIIKNFGDMSWHPDIFNTTVNGGNVKGATRVLTLKDGGTITEEDLGIVIYPGATQIPHKGSKIEAGGKKIVMGQFETADAPDKVIDFYASKLKVSGSAIKSEAMNLVTGTLPSGAKITVSAKTEDGKTHINLNASLEAKK